MRKMRRGRHAEESEWGGLSAVTSPPPFRSSNGFLPGKSSCGQCQVGSLTPDDPSLHVFLNLLKGMDLGLP